MWWEQITGYIDLIFHQNVDVIMDQGIEYLDAYTIYHIKSDKIWALGSKVEHEIMRRQRGRELKDVGLPELSKLFNKTFLLTRNVIHRRTQFFNIKHIKQGENETQDEYRKKLVDIERKCDFNRITLEAISTYKLAAIINDKM